MGRFLRTQGPADESALEWRELGNALRRQATLILGCAAATVSVAYVLTSGGEPLFTASALIRVEEESRASLPRIEERDLVETGNRVATEMEVLRSRTLAEAVVDTLHLQLRISGVHADAPPVVSQVRLPPTGGSGAYRLVRQADGRFRVFEGDADAALGTYAVGAPIPLGGATVVLSPAAAEHTEFGLALRSTEGAVEDLLGRLRVTRTSRDADLIRLEYSDADPARARDIVNALTERFLDMRVASQRAEVRSTIAFLRQQLDTVGLQLAEAEDRLREFRERAQVIDPAAEGSAQVARLSALQAERNALEAERTALARMVAEVGGRTERSASDGGASPYRRLIAFPTLMRNPAAADILRSLIEVENERSELLTRRKMSDPDVMVSSQRIAELEAQLRSFVHSYLTGLANQVAAMDATIAQSQEELNRVPASEVQFARLSRQPQLLAGIHATLKARLTEAEIAQASAAPSIRIVDAATLPTRPRDSGRARPLGAAGVLGLLLGVCLGFVREYRDTSIHSRADVNAALGVPILGLIPHAGARRRLPGGRLALPRTRPAEEPDTSTAQPLGGEAGEALALSMHAYDGLYTNILFSRSAGCGKSVVFTSPLPGDGKTTVAANLAVTLAMRGLRVLLIDADFRRGRIAQLFGLQQRPGLAEVLSEPAVLRDAVQPVPVSGDGALYCIATGAPPLIPSQLLGSDTMRSLIKTLEQSFDRIIIDSPPLNVVSDAAVLGGSGFEVIVVARAGVTPFEALVYAAEQFHHTGTPVLGAVLNDIDLSRDASYDRAYQSYRYAKSYYASTPTERV